MHKTCGGDTQMFSAAQQGMRIDLLTSMAIQSESTTPKHKTSLGQLVQGAKILGGEGYMICVSDKNLQLCISHAYHQNTRTKKQWYYQFENFLWRDAQI